MTTEWSTYCATGVPGGKNRNTRSVSVDGRAVVGERSESIAAVGGTNGEDGGLGSWRDVGGSLGLVTGSDSQENTGGNNTGSGSVHGSGLATTERHVGNSTVGAAAGLDITGNEVDAGNDTRVSALYFC